MKSSDGTSYDSLFTLGGFIIYSRRSGGGMTPGQQTLTANIYILYFV